MKFAIENATSHAAHAALAIVKGVERARAGKAPGVQATCAIHSNWCLIARGGDVIGMDPTDRREVSTVLERLIQSAEPDTIVVDDSAAQFLWRRLELEPVEESSGSPARMYRVVGRERTGFEVGERGLSRFVGRESELELLENRWGLAAQGLGQIVGVVGDPGVGKSRLIVPGLDGLGAHSGSESTGRGLSLGTGPGPGATGGSPARASGTPRSWNQTADPPPSSNKSNVAAIQNLFLRFRLVREVGAAEQRGDARHQMRQRNVFGQVVIGTETQARDHVEIRVARGQKNDRQGG